MGAAEKARRDLAIYLVWWKRNYSLKGDILLLFYSVIYYKVTIKKERTKIQSHYMRKYLESFLSKILVANYLFCAGTGQWRRRTTYARETRVTSAEWSAWSGSCPWWCLSPPSSAGRTRTGWSASRRGSAWYYHFVNVYGAQESIPMNRFRQPV